MQKFIRDHLLIGLSATAAISLALTLAHRSNTLSSALTGLTTGAIGGVASTGVASRTPRKRKRTTHRPANTLPAFTSLQNHIQKLDATVAILHQGTVRDIESLLKTLGSLEETVMRQETKLGIVSKWDSSYKNKIAALSKELAGLREELTLTTAGKQPGSSSASGTTAQPVKEAPKLKLHPQKVGQSPKPLTQPDVEAIQRNSVVTIESAPMEPTPRDHDIPEIRDWFLGHGITIKDWAKHEPLDSLLDDLASYIGNNYASLKEVVRFIKTKVRDEEVVFQFYKSEEEKVILESFGAKLERLSWFQCTKSSTHRNRLLYTPLVFNSRKQEIFDFFNSEWLERYAFVKTAEVLDACNLQYERAKNLTIATNWTGQREFELDVVYLVNGTPLWIECKAWRDPTAKVADLISYLMKYAACRERLGIPKEYALALVLNLSDNQDEALKRYQDFTVVQESDFDSTLQQVSRVLKNGVKGSEVMP